MSTRASKIATRNCSLIRGVNDTVQLEEDLYRQKHQIMSRQKRGYLFRAMGSFLPHAYGLAVPLYGTIGMARPPDYLIF